MSDFFIWKKWNGLSKSCGFLGYQNFGPIPWKSDLSFFTQFLKLRWWHSCAWVFYFQNHPVCNILYVQLFTLINFIYQIMGICLISTHAILTPVISSFWSVFIQNHICTVTHQDDIGINICRIFLRIFSYMSKDCRILPPTQTLMQMLKDDSHLLEVFGPITFNKSPSTFSNFDNALWLQFTNNFDQKASNLVLILFVSAWILQMIIASC